MEMCEYLYPIVQHFHLCGKKKNRQTNRETNTNLRIDCLYKQGGGDNIFCSWSGCLLEMSENLSPIVHSFHLCGKINRQTNRQTNKPLSFDCVHKPRGFLLVERILFRDLQRFIPKSALVRKNKQTEKQTNKQTFETRLCRQAAGPGSKSA